MSEAREIENHLIRPASNALHALQGRLRSWLSSRETTGSASAHPSEMAESSERSPSVPSSTVHSFANSVVRIASIDLDYDPWWLYFRRRR